MNRPTSLIARAELGTGLAHEPADELGGAVEKGLSEVDGLECRQWRADFRAAEHVAGEHGQHRFFEALILARCHEHGADRRHADAVDKPAEALEAATGLPV